MADMENRYVTMNSIPSIKLEQDDFIITNEKNRQEEASPDSLEFKPESSHSSTGHEIPLPSIFASPVKNAPVPPAAESPSTPRTKLTGIDEYPLPSVSSPIKQEPLLSVSSEYLSSPDSAITPSNLNMPSLTPSPAKKRPVSSLRMKCHLKDYTIKTKDTVQRIQCICGFQCNDGFLVQCNKCSIWQHIDCFYTNASSRPVAHRCHNCVPRYVDYENAKQVQQRKMAARSRLTQLVFDSDPHSSRANSNIPQSRPSKRKQSLIARSTPDPRLMHTPDIISMNEMDCVDSRIRRYKTVERNRYTEDLYKQLLRFHGSSFENVKRNLATELSTKECETTVSAQQTLMLTSSSVLSLYDTVIEYRGEFMLKDEYLEAHDPTRDHNPYVLFYSGLHNMTIVVDATKYGNEARFVRRCCKPNCEVKHTFGENNRLHLIIWATQKIVAGKELTIPFDFDYKECNYSVFCPCVRKNCDVRRWCQTRMYNKPYLENDRLNGSLLDEFQPKRLKQSIKAEKQGNLRNVKLEDRGIKTEEEESKDCGRDFELKSLSFSSSLGHSLKLPKDEASSSLKKEALKLSGSTSSLSSISAPVPTVVSRLRSDAEARASLTARLQERLSPSKATPLTSANTVTPSSPVRSLHGISNGLMKNEHAVPPSKPLSPNLKLLSPSKLQQQQPSRRNRRKQQLVALRNPFVEDGNRSSDEEPEAIPVWNIDGIHPRR